MFTLAYVVELAAVIYFTRATARRVGGALLGGAAAGLLALGAIALCRELGWWQIPFASSPYFLPLFYLCLAIGLAPVYLVTWRLARRFSLRGLTVFIGIVTVIGAPRDYLIAASFPEWMVFAPGVAPILADAATYAGIMVVGHWVMSLVAGPSNEDRLTRNPSNIA